MSHPASEPPLPDRLHYLDALRGLAALCIPLWHWQHFFHRGTQAMRFDRERLPAFDVLAPLYLEGWRAVDLFFCLSGFVFFLLYADRVARRRVGARDFAWLRASRLYPLHLATLLLVAALQWLYRARFDAPFVFPFNDAYHFVLNLAFVSAWGFEQGFSFNAPVWSVSVEVLLYGLFFVLCRAGWHRVGVLALLVVVGIELRGFGLPMIGRGVTGFFMGGLVVHAFHFLRRRTPGTPLLVGAGLGVAALYGAAPLPGLAWELVVFPATVLWLALVEVRGAPSSRLLGFLGDVSYSTYLLHFPLQIVFVLGAVSLGLRPRAFF
ncbi:MAG: acyltransferase, partial [Myxococcales bacterium]|nr:acyltransferase [Myxococcales bacterium]